MLTADRPYKEKKNGVNPYVEINEHTAASSQQHVSLFCGNEWLKLYQFYYIINIIVVVIITSTAAVVVAVVVAAEVEVILVIIIVTGRKPIKITL